MRVLPAHGPVAPSSHARVDELLVHHEQRLAKTLAALANGSRTAFDVAHELGWTRHGRSFDELDLLNQGIAAMETKAHLELLVARGTGARTKSPEGFVQFTCIRSCRPMTDATTIGASATMRSTRDHAPPSI